MAFDDGVKTVSGSVAHTDDAATKVPFVSVKCGIAPTLTGKSAVVCTKSGKNLASELLEWNASNRIIAPVFLKNGTYTVSFQRSVAPNAIYIRKGDTIFLSGDAYATKYNSTSFTFTADESTYYYVQLYRSASSTTWEDAPVTKPQIEVGSTATTYEPYTAPTVSTVNLGRTIYGGTADVVNGTGKETFARIDMGDLTWQYDSANTRFFTVGLTSVIEKGSSGWKTELVTDLYTTASGTANDKTISEYASTGYVYIKDTDYTDPNDFKTHVTGHYLVYPLATPTDFTFTPITPTPETVGKVNNVYCNTGDTELTYYDNAHGFAEVTVNKTGKNLSSVSEYNNNPWTFWGTNFVEMVSLLNTLKKGTYTISFDFEVETVPDSGDIHYGLPYIRALVGGNYVNLTSYTIISASSVSVGDIFHVSASFTLTDEYVGNVAYCYLYCDKKNTHSGTGRGRYNLINVQIEVGSETTYEAYSGVSQTAYLHKVIYGGQADVVKGIAEPKNILLPSNTDSASTVVNGVARSYSLDSQTWTLEGTNEKTDANWLIYNGANFVVSKALVVGDTYTYSHTLSDNCYSQFTYKDTNGATRAIGYLVGNTNKNASVTFTIPSNFVELLRFQIGVVKTATSVSEEAVFQLEKASSKTEYAPYFDPFTFPPISIGTDDGENNLFANEGDSAITYRKAVD